ncbi:MAG: carbohydrate binding family 9 domain-containing protein, partial [Gemmatimonadetes bacterium]|nr:carbohydrate binding family 9 domain-containing protein [Gemmatimonadota bacterium]
MNPVLAVVSSVTAVAIFPAVAEARVPVSTVVDQIEIEILGPPPPTGSDVVRWDDEGRATVRATRVIQPLSIDGVLDEPFYQSTASIPHLIQSVPDVGAAPTERMEVWVGFDDDNVYVAARLWDSAPESEWAANEMRRDASTIRSNDNFGVFLDTYYDRRNSVGLYVTPLGGFADLQITNEGSVNFDWNAVWDIRTGRFDGGWTVEIGIPFKTLRYRGGREQTWGIQLRRFVVRKNEWSHLTALPLSVAGNGVGGIMRISMYGTLVGIEAPPASRNIEVKPYAISGIQTDLTVDPAIDKDAYTRAGLDIKYGITQNLTADLTFNTDFAQVEVDEQQVNLTRFSLFFPEKREFFLESRGIFEFGRGGGGSGGFGRGGAPTLFYSRRIGLQGGEPIPILAGGRVTGKIGAVNVGALSIQADDEPSVGAESTNFTVVRLHRDIFARSGIGVLFGNRSQAVLSGGSNQTYGADASLSFLQDASLVGYYAKTRTRGLTGNDQSYQARLRYNGDEWGTQLDHLLVGDDFNPEIGFVQRRGFRQSSASVRWSPRPESIGWIRQLTFQGNFNYFENEQAGFVESRDAGGRFQIELENSDRFSVNFTDSYENLIQDTPISGAVIPAGRYSFRDVEVGYNFGSQRRISGNLSVRRGTFYTGEITSVRLDRARIEILPQLSVEPSVEFNWIDLPDQQAFAGEFNQHVARTRVTYSLTPRTFLSGLVQYNSGTRRVSGNFRFRWEWAPGSEFF